MSTENATAKRDTLVGTTVCGCTIARRIGEGGMGKVYEARQISLDRTVAVKVLTPALGSNEDFLGRFGREARSLATLLHPNLVAIHDFGQEGDIHAVVMEYVDGESVADMLARTNIIPVETSVNIIRQVADGLGAAHSRGIIHCDLKPENILVTKDGTAKVIDFGLAKSLRGDALRITQDGSILGTPNYMSPEQCEGIELDARTDIYSLGATFYRMIAGVDAFDGENPFAIMLKHKSEPPTDPRRFNADISAHVAKIILRTLSKDPDDRFQMAGEVATALVEDPASAETAESVEHPRRGLSLLHDALDAEYVTIEQARRCVAELEKAREGKPGIALDELLVQQGVITPEQVSDLHARELGRERARRDQQFARFALDAGLATSSQISRCVRVQKSRTRRGEVVKLSKIMVEEGVLAQKDVVRLLLRQLKDAQRREDAELVELIRERGLLSRQEYERCIAEQRRADAQGHHRVLRQIVIEFGLLSAEMVRELLNAKVHADMEALLRERTRGDGGADGVVFDEAVLKVEQAEPCPGCGETVALGSKSCPACGCEIEAARREAARIGVATLAEAPDDEVVDTAKVSERDDVAEGKWAVRLPDGEPSQPLTGRALIKLFEEKRLKAESIIRGPLTLGVWRQARHTPRLCRFFGTCHYCGTRLPARVVRCPECGTDPDHPVE